MKSIPLGAATLRLTPAVLALLALSLMAVHRAGALPVEKIRIVLSDAVSPLLAAVSRPFTAAVDSVDGITTVRALRAENIRLAEENARLQQWYETALRLQAENKSLHDLLNVKADPSLSFVTARVISDPGGAFVKSVLLPVGGNDGVQKGNAVMSGKGLAGRVTEAGDRSSRVLLVTDINSRIPVIIQNTRTKAILAGTNGALLQLERLPQDSGISVGERIVTSGEGGRLPPDIPVGTIISIEGGKVTVKPLADIGTLSHVQVINADLDEGLMTGDLSPSLSPRPEAP